MADEQHNATEAAKRQLAADREASEKSREQFAERMKGKPTPTQEENDMAVLGAPVFEKEDDGSGPDPNIPTRNVEGGRPGSYQTRHTTPQQHQQRPVTPTTTKPRE